MVISYPQHIWPFAAIAAEPPVELTDDDDQARRSLAAENARAVSLYSANQLDEALLVLQRLREDARKLPARMRLATSPAISSNMAYYFYKRAKCDAALEWLRRASQAEERAYGTADAATRLRLAAALARTKRHSDALGECRAAIAALQASAHVGDGAEGAEAQRGLKAMLAVAYHNSAIELARTCQLAEASGVAHVALTLAESSVGARHAWCRVIRASCACLREVHTTNPGLSVRIS